MNDLARQTLRELVATHGRTLCDDPKRCEGLLRDFCGQQRREIHVLVSALKERVAADLLAPPTHLTPELLVTQLVHRQQENLAVTEEAARWAVEAWADALGVSLVTGASPGRPAGHRGDGGVGGAGSEAAQGGAMAAWHRARLRDAAGWAAGVAVLWAAVGVSAAALAATALNAAEPTRWLAAAALGGGLLGAVAGGISRAAGGAARETLGWAVSGTVGGAVLGAALGAAAGALLGLLEGGQDAAAARAASWAIRGATAGALLTTVLGAAGWPAVAATGASGNLDETADARR